MSCIVDADVCVQMAALTDVGDALCHDVIVGQSSDVKSREMYEDIQGCGKEISQAMEIVSIGGQ